MLHSFEKKKKPVQERWFCTTWINVHASKMENTKFTNSKNSALFIIQMTTKKLES